MDWSWVSDWMVPEVHCFARLDRTLLVCMLGERGLHSIRELIRDVTVYFLGLRIHSLVCSDYGLTLDSSLEGDRLS